MTSKTQRPQQRADARRNRAKLLAATVAQFAHDGADASLEAIARRAGVGIGTLYRHFPTKSELLEAAYRREVDQLCAAATQFLNQRPPAEALRAWMDRFVDHVVAKRGMGEAMRAVVASSATLSADVLSRLRAAIQELLAAGIAAGTIRSDLTADDVLRAMTSIWLIPDEPGWEEQAHRLLGLLMDGLRHGSGDSRS